MAASVDFEPILAELEADRDLTEKLRERSKELDRAYRAIATTLNKAHSTPSDAIMNIVQQTVPHYAESRRAIRALVDLVPADQYYKVSRISSTRLSAVRD